MTHPAPEREPLPDCRRSIIRKTVWEGHTLLIGIGFYDDGRVGEVFCDTGKTNHMQATLDDACTHISISMQSGWSLDALSKSLSMVPGKVWDREAKAMRDAMLPASPIGVILAEVAAELAEFRGAA